MAGEELSSDGWIVKQATLGITINKTIMSYLKKVEALVFLFFIIIQEAYKYLRRENNILYLSDVIFCLLRQSL